jgi:TraX protein
MTQNIDEGSGMLNKLSWPRLAISDGSLEVLKWLALVLMTVDHVNKFLFNGTNDAAFAAGRVALPLFVFALAYNLARPGVLARGAYLRTMKRLALFGALAIPAFFILGGIHAALRPLNIMFALLTLTATLNLLDRRTAGSYAAAVAVFVVGGANVEYWWPALAFGLAVWWYCKRPAAMPLAVALTALAALWYINSNLWAFLVLPVVLTASLVDLRMPRLRWVFYAYYPVHLFALCLIRIPMSKAGYLFF